MEERGFLSKDEENSVAIARKLLKKGFRLDGVPGCSAMIAMVNIFQFSIFADAKTAFSS